jgi:hypothetical protein
VPGHQGESSRRFAAWALLLLVLAASAAPRVPFLANAEVTLNSDEAVDALVILHLMRGEELTLFNWDARYYGIVEGLMAVPLLALGLAPALACKLASFAGFLGLLAALFLLGRRLYGVPEGLAAAALAAVFSPQVVHWSVNASGGYALVTAWGTLALLQLDRTLGRPRGGNWLALGAILGFGPYIYELFVIYLAAIALAAACLTLLRWRRRPALAAVHGRRAAQSAPGPALSVLSPRGRGWHAGLLLAAGFAAGISPKLAVWLGGAAAAGKQPSYALAGGERVAGNLELLFFQCLPSFFGVNPARHLGLTRFIGYTSGPRALLGVLLLGVYAAAWALALRRVGRRFAGARAHAAEPSAGDVVELVLVLLPAVTLLLFLVSPNPQDASSNRYLLPLLSCMPLLAAKGLVDLARRRRGALDSGAPGAPWDSGAPGAPWDSGAPGVPSDSGAPGAPLDSRAPLAPWAAWMLGVLLIALPLVQLASALRVYGLLDARYRLVRPVEPLAEVVRFLAREGIAGGYGDYWSSYKATLLAREHVLVTPRADWDRYPAYTRRVDALPSEAYIVNARWAERGEPLAQRLAREHRPFAVHRFDPYLVYTSPRHARLLPFVAHALPLSLPRASVTAQVPGAVAAGRTVSIPTVVRNQGGAAWSAEGRPDGWFKVDLSYRWSDAAGREVVSDGLRSTLPRDIEPGGSAELGVTVAAPAAPGRYRLSITVVQEGVCWFDRVGGGGGSYPVEVVP